MKLLYLDRSRSRQIDIVPTKDYLKTSHRVVLIPERPGPLFLNAQEEGGPFNDPPLPRYAQGVPQAGSSQVGMLKPCSCVFITP
jgi:hypothetical protein